MRQVTIRVAILIIAALYAYGASVHVMNMLSMTGFEWSAAPLKWQVLDVIYLLLDVAVVVGLVVGAKFGVIAFFFAALSQIILYTVFQRWIVDVPEAFQRSTEELAYLDGLVIFHVVTVVVMLICLHQSRPRVASHDA